MTEFVLTPVAYDWNGNLTAIPRMISVNHASAVKIIEDGIHLASTKTGGVKLFKRGSKRFHSKKNGGPGSSFAEYLTGKPRVRRRKDADKDDYRLSAFQE